jgi:hypothetical protein
VDLAVIIDDNWLRRMIEGCRDDAHLTRDSCDRVIFLMS